MSIPEVESPLQKSAHKKWPLCLGAVSLLILLASFPLTRQWILNCDIWIAWRLNGLLGHSRLFDILIAWQNGKKGDIAIGVCLAFLGLAHICIPWNRHEVCRKWAFWAWVWVAFLVLYIFQETAEAICRRKSPGQVLPGWFDLTANYHVKTRVRSPNSFPSGHAMAYFFFAIMVARRYWRASLFLIALSIVAPITRMMTGAHWASDIYLSALPLAALAAAIAYETPLIRVNRWLEVIAEKCWHMVADRRRCRLNATGEATASPVEITIQEDL